MISEQMLKELRIKIAEGQSAETPIPNLRESGWSQDDMTIAKSQQKNIPLMKYPMDIALY